MSGSPHFIRARPWKTVDTASQSRNPRSVQIWMAFSAYCLAAVQSRQYHPDPGRKGRGERERQAMAQVCGEVSGEVTSLDRLFRVTCQPEWRERPQHTGEPGV